MISFDSGDVVVAVWNLVTLTAGLSLEIVFLSGVIAGLNLVEHESPRITALLDPKTNKIYLAVTYGMPVIWEALIKETLDLSMR